MAVMYSHNGVIVMPRNITQVVYTPPQPHTLLIDKNGYIGEMQYAAGNTYFACMDTIADFSQSQLGQVTVIMPEFGETVIGERTYKTTKIGSQTWLAENLDLKIEGYTPGTWNDNSISFGYWSDDEATYGIDGTYQCGLLYNGLAVDYLQANKDSLFPGWRVPTKADLDLLINTAQATMLKAQDKTITSSWPLNWNGADSLRLNIIPCGTRYHGSYGYFGTHCDVWSITDSMVSNKWGLEFTQNGASEYNNFYYKNGYSVRLIKDAT